LVIEFNSANYEQTTMTLTIICGNAPSIDCGFSFFNKWEEKWLKASLKFLDRCIPATISFDVATQEQKQVTTTASSASDREPEQSSEKTFDVKVDIKVATETINDETSQENPAFEWIKQHLLDQGLVELEDSGNTSEDARKLHVDIKNYIECARKMIVKWLTKLVTKQKNPLDEVDHEALIPVGLSGMLTFISQQSVDGFFTWHQAADILETCKLLADYGDLNTGDEDDRSMYAEFIAILQYSIEHRRLIRYC
jgi:hypothetical protein